MTIDTSFTAMQLASVYAGYFAKDYAEDVLLTLRGSYPIAQETLSDFIDQKLVEQVGNTPIVLASDNTICRFLFELAEHAIDQGIENPESYAAFEHLASLPSIHHAELGQFVFAASDLYNKTLKSTVIGVVAKDADTASQAIVNAVQARTSMDDTGGTLHFFNWGILNDGLWLNGALLKAYNLANIFRPGGKTVAQHAQTAFTFARQFANFPMLEKDETVWTDGEINSLMSYVTHPELDNLLGQFSQTDLIDVLFSTGAMARKVSTWEKGTKSPHVMVESIKELSALARILNLLQEATAKADQDMAISSTTKDRINLAYDVVVMALSGYEALRETKFNDSLILDVHAPNIDPKVDVIVNKDVAKSFYAEGGEDSDLIRFGLYLDPRKGIPVSGAGWNKEWVMARRGDVIPKVMAEDAERLEKLRFNDAHVISQESQRVIDDVVRSYAEAVGLESLKPVIRSKISDVVRAVSRNTQEISLTDEITNILLSVVGDDTVSKMGQMFMANSVTDSQNARALTIAQMAMTDALDLMTKSPAVDQ